MSMLISAEQFLAERPARRLVALELKRQERKERELAQDELDKIGFFDNVGRAPVRGGCH